ncbi:unnamed protein product [Rotaria sp. Silwood1]|nr:unnamed protein product [Rotaria sp. Silwood1]
MAFDNESGVIGALAHSEIFAIENIHCHTEEGFVSNVPVHIKSIVTERTNEHSGAFLDPYLNQAENKEYPYFPTRDGTMAFTDDSIVEQRCPILVDYLNKALQHSKFRAHPATTVGKDDENSNDEKILKQQQSDTTSTSATDRKHRYFIGKNYSNVYQKDLTKGLYFFLCVLFIYVNSTNVNYAVNSVIRTLVPRMS